MIQTTRLDGGWVPIPSILLDALQWEEGDHISVEVVGDTLICTKISETDIPTRPLRPSRLPRRLPLAR